MSTLDNTVEFISEGNQHRFVTGSSYESIPNAETSREDLLAKPISAQCGENLIGLWQFSNGSFEKSGRIKPCKTHRTTASRFGLYRVVTLPNGSILGRGRWSCPVLKIGRRNSQSLSRGFLTKARYP